MIANRIKFSIISLVVISAFAPLVLRFQLAQALTEASSSTTTLQTDALSTTTTLATTSTSVVAPPPSASVAAPISLSAVHIVGTKYLDYCTDGSKVTSYPGDPAIDANLSKPDAPTPKCPNGMQWDHTAGMDKYDTTSGDLDVGAYAPLADGTFMVHYSASTYTDATSTSIWPDRIVVLRALPINHPTAQPTQPINSTGATDASSSASSAATATQ